MTRKLEILTDLDGIVANLLGPWLAAYNKEWAANLTPGDIPEWYIENVVNPACGKDVYKYLTPQMFRDLEPLPGAVKAISDLRDMGHTVMVCTATVCPEIASEKMKWIKRHLNIPLEDVFICYRKSMVMADILIDDSPLNAEKVRQYQPNTKLISIAYPYNKCTESITDCRAEGWADTEKAWKSIVEYIEAYSSSEIP